MAVGAGGVVLTSPDAITWTQQTSATIVNTNELFAVAGNGAGGFVAIGSSGTIITTSANNNGTSWSVATSNPLSNPSNKLNAITFGNGKYVAVGANGSSGALIASTDGGIGNAWQLVNIQPPSILNGVAYAASTTTDGGVSYTGPATFVAIGAGGTLVTSTDGATWSLQSSIPSPNLNAVTYGRQFLAVGDSGGIFTSTNGTNWTPVTTPGTNNNLHAVTHNTYNYSAVGAAGLNWFAM